MKLYKYLLIPAAALILCACSTNDRQFFSEKQSVYFTNYSDGDRDSLAFSLAGTIDDEAVINISVSLMGESLPKEARFKVVVDPAKTDATVGLHYEALPEYYIFPPEASVFQLPIKVYKDESLNDGFKTIALLLTPTDEIDTSFPDRLRVRVMITNEIVKPVYWDKLLYLYFGDYSKVKHNVCISFMERDFPLTEAEARIDPGIQPLMVYGRSVCQYFIDNVVYDEDNNRIYPWDAF